jgi:hypothetical protein
MKLSNKIFTARVIICLVGVGVISKWENLWWLGLALVGAAIVFGGIIESLALEKERLDKNN